MSEREPSSSNQAIRIRSAPGVRLLPAQAELLARAIGDAGAAFVKQEFRSGYSGAVVMLVSMGTGQAPVVVKFAHPLDLQHEYDAFQQYVVQVSPQNISHLRGEPLVSEDGQLGLLQYTFAGGESHLPATSLRDYYDTQGGEASAAVLNRIFRVYGRHWWGNNRTEVYTLGEQYDRLLPVHLQVSEAGIQETTPRTITAGETSVLELRDVGVGESVRLVGFEITKVREDGRKLTVTAAPPHGEASAPLRIRVERTEAHTCRPGDTIDQIDVVVTATRTDLLADAARAALPAFAVEQAEFTLAEPGAPGAEPSIDLPNPIRDLHDTLDRVVETKISIIHGDLNLQNVLVDPQTGFSWLIDFGETRRGPTLLDLQRLEVQVITKMLPAALAQTNLGLSALVELMASLHADPLPVVSPHPELREAYAMLLTLRKLARHYLVDDLEWDEYYYGLMIALVGALKYDELESRARGLALVGAATARRLAGEPLIAAANGEGTGPLGWAALLLHSRLDSEPTLPGTAPSSTEDGTKPLGPNEESSDAASRKRLYPAAGKVFKGSRRLFVLVIFFLGATTTLVSVPTLQRTIRTVVPGIRCWAPVPMDATRFNVVMAPFVVQSGGGTSVTRDSRDLARFLYSRFENNFEELDLDLPYDLRGPDATCAVHGRDRDGRAQAAQELARKVHASVVIYGVIDLSGDAPAFAPEFYVEYAGLDNVAELTGPYDLGRPLRVDLPLQTGDLVSLAEHPLHARIKALSLIALGLAAYSVDDYDQAIGYFEQAEQIRNWSASAGKEVAYLLLGNAHAMRAARDKSIDDIDAADAYLDQALEIAPDSARAVVSKAGVTYQLALGDPAQLRVSDVDPVLLSEAEALYRKALDMPAPEEANIPARVHYSLGQINLIRYYVLGQDWLDKAKAEFQQVVDAYVAGDTRSPTTVGHSYARLGLIAHQLEKNPEQAIDDYTHAIELVTPHWQIRYLLDVGDVYASMDNEDEAQAKYTEALGIAELYGDDELVQRAEDKLH